MLVDAKEKNPAPRGSIKRSVGVNFRQRSRGKPEETASAKALRQVYLWQV